MVSDANALGGSLLTSEVTDMNGEALLPGFFIGQRKGDTSYGRSTYMLSLGRLARLDDKNEEGEYIDIMDTHE